MNRVSTNMANSDMQYYLRRRQSALNEAQNKVSSQQRIQNLRDDPLGAAHATRYQSHITRLSRYESNVNTVSDSLQITEGYMQESISILQRVRELAVQGSQGTFSAEDRAAMGREVDELLQEFVNIANARSGDGTTLFSGDRTQSLPFETEKGRVPGGGSDLITGVRYTGTIDRNRAEISEGQYIETNIPGNQVFWAENQQLFAGVDATSYQVQQDSTIQVDGVDIPLKEGDNVYSIIAKINDSAAAVKASLDPSMNSLVLQTTTPHQLWLRDGAGSTVLRDLGVTDGTGNPPPGNLAGSARVFGGSAFDMVIQLRDSLFKGDILEIGGSAFQGVDSALNNMLSQTGEIGAKGERLNITGQRIAAEIPQMQQRNSREVDVDLTQAITDLRMLEFANQVALQSAARVIQPTLLDFLR